MAEIRLICPNCATVYQVPEAAIPAGGREVECSECGLSWRAFNPSLAEPQREPEPQPQPAPATDASPADPAPDAPPHTRPLEQRLPANVLNILREAVETERRARRGGEPAPENGVPDIEWPATTIIESSTPSPAASSSATVSSAPVSPAAPSPEPARVLPVKPEPALTAMPDRPAVSSTPPAPAEIAPQVPARQGAYLMGMGVSAMLAAALVAAYMTAPRMADAGGLGAALMDLRHQLDGARLWLGGLVR